MGGRMPFAPTNNHPIQNEDIIFKPQNPVNPDSKQDAINIV